MSRVFRSDVAGRGYVAARMAVAVPTRTPAELEPAPPLEPVLGVFQRCTAPVLIVELADGADVALEPRELLGPRWPCPQCAQVLARGHERRDCLRCGGRRVLGERLPD